MMLESTNYRYDKDFARASPHHLRSVAVVGITSWIIEIWDEQGTHLVLITVGNEITF